MPVKVKNSLIAGLIFVVATAATWTTTSPPVWGQRSWGLIYTFDGEAESDRLGYTVSGAGDVDNDGYDDLIIGAPYNDAGGDRAGRAYVQSGKTGSLLWSLTGEAERDYFGSAVSGAGDVDNDGYDDFIVGAHGNGAEGWMTGKAYVYSGLTGGLLWAFTGEETENYFGWSVSGAGDVDNDGYDDLIVGAYGNEEGGWLAGKAYVYSGQTGGLLWTFTGTTNDALGASVSGAGDVDNDGYADVIVGAPTAATFDGRAYVYSGQTGATLHTFTGEAEWEYFGWSVSGAGDVNDDGYDDLIVGAYENDAGGTEAGRAYVYCGQTGDLLRTFTGEAAGDSLGYSVSGADDVNDDGYDDLIVGAHGAAGGKGRAQIYSGQSGNLLQAFTGEATDDRFGKSVSGAGDVNNDGMPDVIVGAESHDAGGIDAGRAYVYSGVGYQTDCHDISPEAGVIIQHDQIGHTWYEFQQSGSMGRMISVSSGGHRHFSWMSSDGEYPPGYRHVYANCKDPAGQYIGEGDVDGAIGASPGYSNQAHTTDGRSVVVYHRTYHQAPDPATHCMLGIESSVCSRDFDYLWDLPDEIPSAPSEERCLWPRLAVKYDEEFGGDRIHVVVTEGNPFDGEALMVAYQRCYEGTMGQLICQAYVDGSTQTYTLDPNVNYPHNEVAPFDYTCSRAPVVEVSFVSERVVIAFVKPACDDESCDYLGDIAYVESMVNGDDWIDGSNYPPQDTNITMYGCGYPEDERAWSDLNACYDYNDSLHVVWSTVGFPDVGYHDPGVSKLYHWSKETGKVMITSAIWGGTDPGAYNANIAKMSISAMDPIHHPPDSTYLYCIWTQFNPDDNAFNRYSNGDIYGAGSRDGGSSWGPSYNLTNTKTPNCLSGDCLSEHWASLAQNLQDGKLHIQYVCDKHAGVAIYLEGEWTENPVMYLELEAWDPGTSFIRGDANGDETVNVADIVYTVNFLYRGGDPPDPMQAGDANSDDIVNVADVVYLVNYLYRGGDPPS